MRAKIALVVPIAALVASCSSTSSSEGGSLDAANAAYGPRSQAVQVTYAVTTSNGSKLSAGLVRTGEKTVGGKSFAVWQATGGTNPDPLEVVLDNDGLGTITVAGGTRGASKSLTVDPPFALKLSPTVGASQPASVSGTITLPGSPPNSPANATGQYTLVSTSETVTTSTGVLHGVSKFTGNGTAQGDAVPETFRGKPITGTLFYHPSHGVVAASSPELGAGLDMAGSSDCGAVEPSGYRHIRKMGVISTENPTFLLDSYGCAGNKFDADKNTHAKMLVELRWLSEDSAKTDNKPGEPMIRVEAGTVMGVFPCSLASSPVSIFHPEENGTGMKFWYCYVNEAAKNEPGDAHIAYHVRVRTDSGFSPVRVTARIYYKTLP